MSFWKLSSCVYFKSYQLYRKHNVLKVFNLKPTLLYFHTVIQPSFSGTPTAGLAMGEGGEGVGGMQRWTIWSFSSNST